MTEAERNELKHDADLPTIRKLIQVVKESVVGDTVNEAFLMNRFTEDEIIVIGKNATSGYFRKEIRQVVDDEYSSMAHWEYARLQMIVSIAGTIYFKLG